MNPMQSWYCAALCALACHAAVAQVAPLPAPRTQDGISYVSGGVGSDEAAAFRTAAGRYNLRLTFSTVSGEYCADVHVMLRDEQGRSLADLVSDGPFLFLDVGPGTYTVTAEFQGSSLSRVVRVGARRATELYLRWPSSTASRQ